MQGTNSYAKRLFSFRKLNEFGPAVAQAVNKIEGDLVARVTG